MPYRSNDIRVRVQLVVLLGAGGACGDSSAGGGDAGETGDENLVCPADPEPLDCSDKGEWSGFTLWNEVPPTLPISESNDTVLRSGVTGVHAIMLHNGHVMLWQGRLDQRTWDPDSDSFSWYPLTSAAGADCGIPADGTGDLDLFCSGHALDADGRLVTAGGNITSNASATLECVYAFDPDGPNTFPVDPTPYDPWNPNSPPDPPPPTAWNTDNLSPLGLGRWYPTMTTLANGTILATGGDLGQATEEAEILQLNGQWLPTSAPTFDPTLYPFMFVLPGGDVFYAGAETAATAADRAGHILNVRYGGDVTTGSWLGVEFPSTVRGGSAAMFRPGEILKSGGGSVPSTAAERIDFSSIDVSGIQDTDVGALEAAYGAVSFQDAGQMAVPRHFHTMTVLPDGTVLVTGGNKRGNGRSEDRTDNPCFVESPCDDKGNTEIIACECSSALECPPLPSSCRNVFEGTCESHADCTFGVCDPNTKSCVDRRCYFHDRITCASDEDCQDGVTCFVPEGAPVGFCRQPCESSNDCTPVGACTGGACDPGNNACYATREAEVWDPVSNSWCLMPAEQQPRMYHSTALLLPDGRVFSTSGGRRQGLDDQSSVEFFTPGYMDNGPRPEVESVPAELQWGQQFDVEMSEATGVDDIGRVVLVRLGTVTHGFNMDQRWIDLGCWKPQGSTLTLTAPDGGDIAPPGYYMLFVLSKQRVPSVGRIVKVGGP